MRVPTSSRGSARSHANPELRREAVRQRVAEQGFVRVDDLAGEHGVSIMTVHRDLDQLEARGFLLKVRGGATSAPTRTFHGDMAHRMQAQAVVRLSGQRLGLLINFNVFPVVKGVHRIGAKP